MDTQDSNTDTEDEIIKEALKPRRKSLALVADDSPVLRRINSKFLQGEGFEVIEAVNGEDAVQKVTELKKRGRKLSLVLMDYQMPVKNGKDATAEITKQEGNDSPIIGVTSETSPRTLDNFKQSGLSDIYSKPLTKAKVQDIIRKHSH